MEQIVVARTGQRVGQRPQHGPARPPMAAGGVPFGYCDLDASVRSALFQKRADLRNILLHAVQVRAPVMMGTDIVQPLSGSSQYAFAGIAGEEFDGGIGFFHRSTEVSQARFVFWSGQLVSDLPILDLVGLRVAVAGTQCTQGVSSVPLKYWT